MAGDRDHLALLAARDLSAEGAGERKGRNRIDLECLKPGLGIQRARIRNARALHSGIGDQKIDAFIRKRMAERGELRGIRDIEWVSRDFGPQFAQPLRRRATRRDDAPSVAGILAAELETETAALGSESSQPQR
jgi:hypothetical protein